MSQSLVVSISLVNCQLSLESYIFYIGAKSSIESKKPIHLLMAYTNQLLKVADLTLVIKSTSWNIPPGPVGLGR